jgi:hypothetical protein
VRIARSGLLKLEMLDASLDKPDYTSAAEDNTTVLKIKQPARTDPYATVLKLTFAR